VDRDEMLALDRRIAVEALGEPEPSMSGDRLAVSSPVSKGDNWRIAWSSYGTDEPKWVPMPFSFSFTYATRAADHFFGPDPHLMIERYRNHQTGELEWSVYHDMKWSYGETLPLALCRLIVKHLDKPDANDLDL
jgi:hypothetical protein